MKTRRLTCVALGLFTACLLSPVARAQVTRSGAAAEAEEHYKARRWPEAVKAYEAVTKSEPANGSAWLRLGATLHWTGRYKEAIAALQRAVYLLQGPTAMYNLACAYARDGDKERALEWLAKAVDKGGMPAEAIRNDEDLASLRQDARFIELVSSAEKKAAPCLHEPRHRQFDFWLGEWDVVTTEGGQPAGSSSIRSEASGCLVLENWTGKGGATGKSFNFYNPERGKWQQTWVGSRGGVLEYAGDYADGAMRYEATGRGPGGARVLLRLTFFDMGPGRVRQFAEQSTDEGKTWTPQYDLTYIKKN